MVSIFWNLPFPGIYFHVTAMQPVFKIGGAASEKSTDTKSLPSQECTETEHLIWVLNQK